MRGGDERDGPTPEGLDTQALRGSLERRMFGEEAAPTTVGRFEILHAVGRGGMGAVYAAHDPQLDRRVALKLLHNDRGPRDSGPGEDLLAEARALARLNHANVVTIYETGVHEGALFLAMEFLDGGTLVLWGREHPVRTPADARATVRLYLRAGAGLVAAHEAGLVHRDFKPANVLLGRDGRLAVADFGLARGSSISAADLTFLDEDPSDQGMTTATFAGTPAYMSPEQFEGVVDARSDQFSFCVSLWEALFGRRPFEGKTPTALQQRMREGEPSIPTGAARVPRGIESALRRGLSVEPEDRWPSMTPLLAALAYDPAERVRRAVVVVAAGGVLGMAAWQPWEREASPCEGAEDALEVAWGSPRRDEVAAALTSTDSEFGRQTLERVEQGIDAYVERWHQVRSESCQASLVRRERSQEAYDLTMQCLNTRRDELDAVTSVLAEGDVSVAARAVAAVAALSPASQCTDLEALRSEAPQDPQRAEERGALERERLRIRALLDTGQHLAAAAASPAAVAAARAANDDRALARALELHGRIVLQGGQRQDAQAPLQEALRLAASAGDDALAARVWPSIVGLVDQPLGDPRPLDNLRLAAETVVLRGGNHPTDRAALHHAFGDVARKAKSFDEAEREHKAGLALRREHMADQKLEVADSLNKLAGVYFDRRELPEAEAMAKEVIAAFTDALGADHPNVATVGYNLAGIFAMQGKYEEAIAAYENTLRIYGQVYGPRSLKMATALNNLAAVLGRTDRFEEAIAKCELAAEIISEHEGDHSPKLAAAYNNLGAAYDAAGRLEDSLAAHVKVVELLEDQGPSDQLALNLSNLGLMQDALDRPEQAVASFLRSIEMFEKTLGSDHPDIWRPLAMLARLHRKRGRLEEALPLAERAVKVLDGHEVQPIEVADARFELARIRRLVGLDDDRTTELATSARDLWRANGGDKEAAKIETWLSGAPAAP